LIDDVDKKDSRILGFQGSSERLISPNPSFVAGYCGGWTNREKILFIRKRV